MTGILIGCSNQTIKSSSSITIDGQTYLCKKIATQGLHTVNNNDIKAIVLNETLYHCFKTHDLPTFEIIDTTYLGTVKVNKQ